MANAKISKKVLIFSLCFSLAVLSSRDKALNAFPGVPDWNDIYNKRPAFTKGWKFIIIHHSATKWGSAKSFHEYHTKKGFGGLAYHFVIGNGHGTKDGRVEAGFRWQHQISGTHCTVDAWYHNLFGIGICLVGNFENARPTIKQRISLIKLIKKLSKKYNIPQQNVMGHGDTPHSEIEWDASKLSVRFLGGRHEQRVCPGKFFPMNYIIRKVYGRLDKRRRRYTD